MANLSNNLLKRWLRRSVSLPLLFLATSSLLLLLPLTLSLALLVDALRRRIILCRAVLFFTLFLVCESLGIAICLALWLLRPFLGRHRFLRANLALQLRWAETLRRAGFWLYGIRVEIHGQDVLQKGPYLLLMRHSSMADTMLPIMLAGAPYGIWLRWVMKRELLWDPCLDVVGNRLPNCFVGRAVTTRDEDLAAIRLLGRGLGPKEGVVLWPEGTRFSQAKRERILRKLKAQASQQEWRAAQALEHVLPIRPGGTMALIQAAPQCDLVFCAHYGLDKAVRFQDLWHGSVIGSPLRVDCFRIPASEVPSNPEQRVAFLRTQWQRVDHLVGAARAQAETKPR